MIPSGLQALMQASAVLQQQASQTAPGPQGQQPTVASQVMQQAQQAAQPPQMPQMQDVGRQAGLAGQLMAQQQQQQQQMAQNPQAIAQMAAQMLQQKGVAGLPTNMQFREGGIIGFSGEERSDVPDPEAGLSMAERAERTRRLKGSIYDPYFGLPPAIREAMRRDEEARREGIATPESIPIPGPAGTEDIPRARSERESIEAEQRAREQRLQDVRELQQRREARRAGLAAALPQAQQAAALAGGERALEEYYVPYPTQGPMRATTSRFVEPTPAVTPDVTPKDTAARPAARPSDAAATPAATPTAAPTSAPTTPSASGIATLVPERAKLPTAPTYESIKADVPESVRKRQAELDAATAARLAAGAKQEDLTPQGIAALEAAKTERQRLLESARSRDIFQRLSALFTSLRTLGNEVGVVENAIKTREEAAITANLLHEDSVLKLKQAKQARDLGEMDKAIALRREGLKEEQDAVKLAQATERISADLAKSKYEVESRETTHAADRANQLKIRLAEMKQTAQQRQDDAETRRILGLQTRLTAAENALTKARAEITSQLKNSSEFKNIGMIEDLKSAGAKLSPDQQATLNRFATVRQQLEQSTLSRLNAQIDDISKQLGIEVPKVPTVSGNLLSAIEQEIAKRTK